jgi:hypothetical protein
MTNTLIKFFEYGIFVLTAAAIIVGAYSIFMI